MKRSGWKTDDGDLNEDQVFFYRERMKSEGSF